MANELKGNDLFMSLLETLTRYVSPITARSILRKTIELEKIDPDRLDKSDLERVYQSTIFASMRLFCDPEKLTGAMLDLAKLIE